MKRFIVEIDEPSLDALDDEAVHVRASMALRDMFFDETDMSDEEKRIAWSDGTFRLMIFGETADTLDDLHEVVVGCRHDASCDQLGHRLDWHYRLTA